MINFRLPLLLLCCLLPSCFVNRHRAPGGLLPTKEVLSRQNKQAKVFPLGQHVFRFRVRHDVVWNAVIDVLLRNYNLNIVDERNGVITTEWDSFFVNKDIYRNKVSIRIVKVGYQHSQLSIFNNVEVLRNGTHANVAALTPVWLPSQDSAGEGARIIRSIAASVGAPPPRLPPSMAVSEGKTDPAELKWR